MAVLNYLGDAYPAYAASVLAGNDFTRSTFGAAFPLFATQMYHKLGVGWASTLLGCLAILFIPIPFVLYKVSLLFGFITLRNRTSLLMSARCVYSFCLVIPIVRREDTAGEPEGET